MPSWDIFCSVVDNYGDIGVTWRLARQLVAEFDAPVRLWVDDLGALQKLWPAVADVDEQQVAGVNVRRWAPVLPAVEPADVVIEAFACTLPASYIDAMAQRSRRPVWINLEYLSAEPWVADCHGLASPQSRSGLQKYFFFPGFGARTGGVLGARELPATRRAFQAGPGSRHEFLARLGVAVPAGARVISLFAYPQAPVAELLTALATGPQPTLCLVPEGPLMQHIASFFGESALPVGTARDCGAVQVMVLPFLQQDDYDRLLWSCDLNCVRGEDSFVRAQWAARPFIWHIYPQDNAAHWPKLDAFLDLYTRGMPSSEAAALIRSWHAWNGAGAIGATWPLPEAALTVHAERWADELAAAENLAARLVQFCANRV